MCHTFHQIGPPASAYSRTNRPPNFVEPENSDVKRYLRQQPESLLKIELDKLMKHCQAVIREGGTYVTH